ncbi:MAG: hypothetical protein D6B25_20170 [Desulfobulbaceae bacterium]|nr:MAG: hypothetical protein D6B25_20170 [Desulfobulbaceae bacterium]
MCGRADFYIDEFRKLAQSTDPESSAKAALLFSITELITTGNLTKGYVEPTELLEQTFKKVQVNDCKRSGVLHSFAKTFLLMNEYPYWQLKPKPARRTQHPEFIDDLNTLRQYYYGAELSPEFFPLLQMPAIRKKIRDVLKVKR